MVIPKKGSNLELANIIVTRANVTSTLSRVARVWRREGDKVLAKHGITHAAAWIVVYVGEYEGMSFTQLAEAMDVKISGIVDLVQQLVTRGYLEKRDSPVDARTKSFHLTESGRGLNQRIRDELTQLRERLFANISQGELDTVLRVFRQIETNLGRPGLVSDWSNVGAD